GQTLAVIEAMKMEHAIRAPADGTVAAVHVSPGELVAGGVALIALADDETAGSDGGTP
ncbi:MAG: acetyl-CoA carboxylase biotin carboxyl carrier protein subunit, partial [Pseudomonadota bacterium]